MYFNAEIIANFIAPTGVAVAVIAVIIFLISYQEDLATRLMLSGGGINVLYLYLVLLLQGHCMVIDNFIVMIAISLLLPTIGIVLEIIGAILLYRHT